MTSENLASPTLVPELFEHWDDEEDLRWKAPLDALINNTQTPLQAAQTVDNIVRAATTERLQKLIEYASSHDVTVEEDGLPDFGGLGPPNAGPIADTFMRWFGRVCMAFSPYSESQNRFMQFLEELRNLPRWMAPEGYPNENGDCSRTEFWSFGYNWVGHEDEFRGLLGDVKPKYYRDPAAHNRWRNFQHIMARLTANKFVYCAPFNALFDLEPSSASKSKPNLEYDIIAAAQWVIWPTECSYVYQECLKQETATFYWYPWAKDQWQQWKREFELVGENVQYDDQARSVARQALQRMKDIEEEVRTLHNIGNP
ncbi:hypothetical protein BDV95DRAFT_139300 [Massariosphaeria phaeospora]|uniref:Uncharacterized protein n=1 Tax=Massariosphaeria phaeospora TaxID=100035 RepID=A0A7C8IIC2_9PLEO|nr:hypothetical protein BDV95DRAFT_139300 [Massariosphaeria phaeospora]